MKAKLEKNNHTDENLQNVHSHEWYNVLLIHGWR